MAMAESASQGEFERIRTELDMLKTIARLGESLVELTNRYQGAVSEFDASFAEAPTGYEFAVIEPDQETGGVSEMPVYTYPDYFRNAQASLKDQRNHFVADGLTIDVDRQQVIWLNRQAQECVIFRPAKQIWNLQRRPDGEGGDREPLTPIPTTGPTARRLKIGG